MPFGLKNDGATYMRPMTAIFHYMIHQEIEVYVDDVIIKSRTQDDHVRDLNKFFEWLHKYDLKLNPAKCAFGVPSGKPLGFIVSRRGIELDPTKIKSIRDLPPPRTKKEVMNLLARLNCISRFIAQLASTCEPIFKMLTKDVAIKWTDECQEAFDKIKEYLSNTPVLAQALVDHLAENPVNDEYQPLSTYFPDEELNSVEVTSEETNVWKMFFNGAMNAKGIGIGAILISPTGQHYPATARLQFFCTNNTIEYEACIMGINMAIRQHVKELLIMGDSDLIIRQAQGEWETRDVKLIPYKQLVEDLSKRFKSVEFRYIPRFHNELADALATLASMLPYPGNLHTDPLEIQIRERHSYYNTVETELDVQPWYHDIKRFLKIKEYPEQARGDQKRTIRRLASDFFLSGEVLYKRTPNLNLIRCVDIEEAGRIMYEVHAGVYGPHMNRYVLGKKILRAGY
ncbi:uncharacterized protein [Nicotiana sylvestris]|uniref:uncharacterized protein n=1 Tax=Nicotiana sylvestris TaxID=4096 RepID=UPI00388CCF35